MRRQCCIAGRPRPAAALCRGCASREFLGCLPEEPSRLVEHHPARLFVCSRCRAQVLLCTHCDRGQRYCGRVCSRAAREDSRREAAQRYQRSRAGLAAKVLRDCSIWRIRRIRRIRVLNRFCSGVNARAASAGTIWRAARSGMATDSAADRALSDDFACPLPAGPSSRACPATRRPKPRPRRRIGADLHRR